MQIIDKMDMALKKEHAHDDNKKEYFAAELDTSDDKMMELEQAHEDLEIAIAKSEEEIAALV